MNTSLRRTLLGAMLSTLAITLPGQASAQEVLRIGGVIFGQHSSVRALKEVFAPEVAKSTNGRYKVELYTDGQLGGNAEMVQQTRNGTIFGAIVSSAWITSYVPKIAVSGLPFLFETREAAFRTFDGPIGQEVAKAMDTAGLAPLGFMELGFRHLTTSTKRISSPEDLKGLKIRLQANPVHQETFRRLGANPVQIDGSEMFAALGQGVADGQENPYSVISLFKLYDAKQRYLTETGHFYDALTFIGSRRMMERMTADDRDAILAAARRATALQRIYAADEESRYKADLVAKGVQITTLTPEQRKAFRDATASVYEKTEKDMGGDFVKRFVAAARGNAR
jgi:tripartite ATP-independent transporter DctP family solute receptor